MIETLNAFLKSDPYVWCSFGVTLLTGVIFLASRIRKRHARRCPCGCGPLKQTHKLLPNLRSPGNGRNWLSYTFSECRESAEVWVSKRAEKNFSYIEYEWRRKVHPQEFVDDADLFCRADEPLPNLPKSVMVQGRPPKHGLVLLN